MWFANAVIAVAVLEVVQVVVIAVLATRLYRTPPPVPAAPPPAAPQPNAAVAEIATPDIVVAAVDREKLDQIVDLVAQQADEVGVLASDDLDEFASVMAVLDPRGRDFGTDTAVLVSACVALGVLRLRAPLLGLTVEPTVVGESRDGGFLLLVHQGPLTLASARVAADRFTGAGTTAAEEVLGVVADLVCAMSATMTAATTGKGSR